MYQRLGVEFLERRRVLNTAPILDASKSLVLSAVAENVGPPSHAVGTPASSLLAASGEPGNFTDVDGNAPGIAITKTTLQGGRLWYSTDVGGAWRDVWAVSESAPRLIPVEPGTRFFFQPSPNWSGTIDDVFTFRAWDRVVAWPQVGADFSGPEWRDDFGYAVAVSSDGSIVAVADAASVSFGGGQVSVYQRDESGWVRVGQPIDTNGYFDDDGDSVALSGDGKTVVVGTPLNDGQTADVGNVAIFRWNGLSWGQLGQTISGRAAGDRTGWAVSISEDGETVAVGSPQAEARNGFASVYRWNGEAWSQLGEDIAGGGFAGARMGWAISLSADGRSVAVGATKASAGLNSSGNGLVRVFSWDGTAWHQVGSNLWGGQAGDELGWSVSLSGDGKVVAAGARYAGQLAGPTYRGQVLVHRLEQGVWVPAGTITGELGHDESGASVSLSRDGLTLAIGAPGKRQAGLGDGHARVYRWDGTSWSKLGPDIDGGTSELLGHAVALSSDGNTIVAGAPSISGQGTARAYQLRLSVSSQTDTVRVTVSDRNDRPVLRQGATTPELSAEVAAAAPVGAVGTLVSDLIESDTLFTDIDNDHAGIALTDFTGLGTLWFTINGGQTWADVGAVSDRSARMLYADSLTRIYYQNASAPSGTLAEVVRFRAWDRRGGHSNGVMDVSIAPAQVAAGGTGADSVKAVAALPDGSSLVTGSFEGSASFGTHGLTSNGADDIFVAKLDSRGTYVWATRAGGAFSAVSHAITALPDGTSIITGEFFQDASFGSITLNSGGRNVDVFVAKLSAVGEFLWAVRAGGTGADAGYGVAVAADGSCYVTGAFNGTATFGGVTLVSAGAEDVFIAKLDPQGSVLWARRAGGTGSQIARAISVSADGSAILAGSYTLSATFGSVTLPSAGNQSFVAKIDSTGSFLWATRASTSDWVLHSAISTMGDGSALVTGGFQGTATFDNMTITSAGLADMFVAKISSAGRWVWVRRAGGSGADQAYGISALPDETAVIVGRFAGTVSVGSTTVASNGSDDAFALRVDGSGNFLWARGFGGQGGDNGAAVAALPTGALVVSGSFVGTALFGTRTLTSSGAQDAFVVYVGAEGDCDLWDFIGSIRLAANISIALPTQSNERVIEVPFGGELIDAEPRTGPIRVVVRGGGRVILSSANTHTEGTVVEAGELVIRNTAALGAGGLEVRPGARVVLEVGYDAVNLGSLALDATGRLELGTGRVTVPAGGYDLAALRQLLSAGRNGGTWDGPAGVTSRAAGVGTKRAVGYIVSAGTLTLGWAAHGDLNLDGRVNSTDLSLLTGGGRFNRPGSDSVWAQGDFNYDGRVNSTDISLLTGAALFNKPSYRTGSGTVAAASLSTSLLRAAVWYSIGAQQSGVEDTTVKARVR